MQDIKGGHKEFKKTMEEKTKVKVKDVNLFSVVEEIDVLMTK